MLSTTSKHTGGGTTRASAVALTSVSDARAHGAGWLWLGVLASALVLAAPGVSSAQSITPERALMNRGSIVALEATHTTATFESKWPSGAQALLASGDATRGFTRSTAAQGRAVHSKPDGEQALLGRRKLGSGAGASNGSKP